jgi:hypothetical protein
MLRDQNPGTGARPSQAVRSHEQARSVLLEVIDCRSRRLGEGIVEYDQAGQDIPVDEMAH